MTDPIESFSSADLRKLRSLKDPHGIQKYLNAQPYHLADTAGPHGAYCAKTLPIVLRELYSPLLH